MEGRGSIIPTNIKLLECSVVLSHCEIPVNKICRDTLSPNYEDSSSDITSTSDECLLIEDDYCFGDDFEDYTTDNVKANNETDDEMVLNIDQNDLSSRESADMLEHNNSLHKTGLASEKPARESKDLPPKLLAYRESPQIDFVFKTDSSAGLVELKQSNAHELSSAIASHNNKPDTISEIPETQSVTNENGIICSNPDVGEGRSKKKSYDLSGHETLENDTLEPMKKKPCLSKHQIESENISLAQSAEHFPREGSDLLGKNIVKGVLSDVAIPKIVSDDMSDDTERSPHQCNESAISCGNRQCNVLNKERESLKYSDSQCMEEESKYLNCGTKNDNTGTDFDRYRNCSKKKKTEQCNITGVDSVSSESTMSTNITHGLKPNSFVSDAEDPEFTKTSYLRRSPRTRRNNGNDSSVCNESDVNAPQKQPLCTKEGVIAKFKSFTSPQNRTQSALISNESGVRESLSISTSMPPVRLLVKSGVGLPLMSSEAHIIHECLDHEFRCLSTVFAELSVSVVKAPNQPSKLKKSLIPVTEKKLLNLMDMKWNSGAPLVLTTVEEFGKMSYSDFNSKICNINNPNNLNPISGNPLVPVKNYQSISSSLIKTKQSSLECNDNITEETCSSEPEVNNDESKIKGSNVTKLETHFKKKSERKASPMKKIDNLQINTLANAVEHQSDIIDTNTIVKCQNESHLFQKTEDASFQACSDNSLSGNDCSVAKSPISVKPSKKSDTLSTRNRKSPISNNSILARDKIKELGVIGSKRGSSIDPDEATRLIIPESEKKYPEPSFDPDDTRGVEDLNIEIDELKRTSRVKSKMFHELRRLNVALFDVSDSIAAVACSSTELCRLGCVCQSLQGQVMRDHCGKVSCMFICSCNKSDKSSVSNNAAFAWMEKKAKENLAKEEQHFKQTAVRSGNDSVVLVESKRKREIKLPGRYRDDYLVGENDKDFRVKSQNLIKLSKSVLIPSGTPSQASKPSTAPAHELKKPKPFLVPNKLKKTKHPPASENEQMSSKLVTNHVDSAPPNPMEPLEVPMSSDDLLIQKKQRIASLSSGSIGLLKSRAVHRNNLIKRSRNWKKIFGAYKNRFEWDSMSMSEKKGRHVKHLSPELKIKNCAMFNLRQCNIPSCSVLLDASIVGRHMSMREPADLSLCHNVALKSTSKTSHTHNVVHSSARTSSYVEKVKSQWLIDKHHAMTSVGENFPINPEFSTSSANADNEVALQISSVQSLPHEHWESSAKEGFEDEKGHLESVVFSTYLASKQDHNVVLLPANILREEVLSEKVFLWLKLNKLKGKGRIYICEGSAQPCPNCLDVRFIPMDSEDFMDIPFNIKTLRPDFLGNIDENSMWIAKLYKSQWTLVGFLQPDGPEVDLNVSCNEDLNSTGIMLNDDETHQESFRWWMMDISNAFDYILFLDYNVLVNQSQIISIVHLSNLNSSSCKTRCIRISYENRNSILNNPHPDFGIYGLSGLPNHVAIGPYGLTQEPKINVLSKAISKDKEGCLKRLPLFCCGIKQSVQVNSRGVLSSAVDSLPPGHVKGFWLHSSKSCFSEEADFCANLASGAEFTSSYQLPEGQPDFSSHQGTAIDPYGNLKPGTILQSVSNWKSPYSNRRNNIVLRSPTFGNDSSFITGTNASVDVIDSDDDDVVILEPESQCSKTDKKQKSSRKEALLNPLYSPTGSEDVKKEYLVPSIRSLGFISVSIFPNNTLSIPHFKKQGLLQFYHSVEEVINEVNNLIHHSIAAQSVRCSKSGNFPLKCNCVKWKSFLSLKNCGLIYPLNIDMFNGFFILTHKGLFDVREVGEGQIKERDWHDWLSRGDNKTHVKEWQRKKEKEQILHRCEKLAVLLRGHDQGVTLPVENVLVMAAAEIAKLVAQEQLLLLEKRTQKLLRKTLLSSLSVKDKDILVAEDLDASLLIEEDRSSSLLESDSIIASHLSSGAVVSVKKKKLRNTQKSMNPSKARKNQKGVDNSKRKGLVHCMAPFSRLNISVEEGGIVHTIPAASNSSNNCESSQNEIIESPKAQLSTCLDDSVIQGKHSQKTNNMLHSRSSNYSSISKTGIEVSSGRPRRCSSSLSLTDLEISDVYSLSPPEIEEMCALDSCKRVGVSGPGFNDVITLRESSHSPDVLVIDEMYESPNKDLSSVVRKIQSQEGIQNLKDKLLLGLSQDIQKLSQGTTCFSDTFRNQHNVVAEDNSSFRQSNKISGNLTLIGNGTDSTGFPLPLSSLDRNSRTGKDVSPTTNIAPTSVYGMKNPIQQSAPKFIESQSQAFPKKLLGKLSPQSNATTINISGSSVASATPLFDPSKVSSAKSDMRGNVTFSFHSPTVPSVSSDTVISNEKLKSRRVLFSSANATSNSSDIMQQKNAVLPEDLKVRLPISSHSAIRFSKGVYSEASRANNSVSHQLANPPVWSMDENKNATSTSSSIVKPAFLMRHLTPKITLPASSITAANGLKTPFSVRPSASGPGNALARGSRPIVLQATHSSGRALQLVCSVSEGQGTSLLKCSTIGTPSSSTKPFYVISGVSSQTALTKSTGSLPSAPHLSVKTKQTVPKAKVQYIKMNSLNVPIVCSSIPKINDIATLRTTSTTDINETVLDVSKQEIKADPKVLASCREVLTKLFKQAQNNVSETSETKGSISDQPGVPLKENDSTKLPEEEKEDLTPVVNDEHLETQTPTSKL